MSVAGFTVDGMTKVRTTVADGILARLDDLDTLSHPLAETIEPGRVWRVHGHGEGTIGWVRYWTPPSDGKRWHLYYDRLVDGQRPWCASFDSFNSAVAYAVQHTTEMRALPPTQPPTDATPGDTGQRTSA